MLILPQPRHHSTRTWPYERAWLVPCPACHAEIDRPCAEDSIPRSHPHYSRVRAALWAGYRGQEATA